MCETPPEGAVPYVQVADARRTLAVLGANFFGHPAEHMTMIGVTGTNGKTTTTYLLKAVLEQALGAKVGLIGTNQNMIGGRSSPRSGPRRSPGTSRPCWPEMRGRAAPMW